MCIHCVVSSVDRYVNTLDSQSIDSDNSMEKNFESLVSVLHAAATFDHSENRFPWAKAVAVLAPQMVNECMPSGKFVAPTQRRMLEFTRNALVRLTSISYNPSEADQERKFIEALDRVKDALESLDEA